MVSRSHILQKSVPWAWHRTSLWEKTSGIRGCFMTALGLHLSTKLRPFGTWFPGPHLLAFVSLEYLGQRPSFHSGGILPARLWRRLWGLIPVRLPYCCSGFHPQMRLAFSVKGEHSSDSPGGFSKAWCFAYVAADSLSVPYLGFDEMRDFPLHGESPLDLMLSRDQARMQLGRLLGLFELPREVELSR